MDPAGLPDHLQQDRAAQLLWHFNPEIPGSYPLVNAKGQDNWAYLRTSQPTYAVMVRR